MTKLSKSQQAALTTILNLRKLTEATGTRTRTTRAQDIAAVVNALAN